MTDLLVPLILASVAVWGLWKKVNIYEALLCGIGEGCSVVVKMLPGMIALLTGVSMLRASGAFDLLAQALAPVFSWLNIPAQTAPLLFVRPFSGSAALGVGSELIATYGADSLIGRTAAVMLGSSETTFYTIAVYFGAVGITKTRYAIPAALCADIAAFAAAAFAVRLCFG